MIPGSDNFWGKVKGLEEENEDTSNKKKGVLAQNRKIAAAAKALTWGEIRAMNEAYLKDIETKNITIKPDVGIEDLMKQVQTYKLERKAFKYRLGVNKKVNKSVPNLNGRKESKMEVGQAILDDTLDFTGNTQ